MAKLNPAGWVAYVLVLIGGLNWGLWGIFQFDLVAAIFGGNDSGIARIVYTLVGLGAVYLIVSYFCCCKKEKLQSSQAGASDSSEQSSPM